MRSPRLLFALLAACGSTSADKGGNVSFGGAQDLGEFRSILDAGGIPGPDTLDANGFFNEHYTSTPPANCGHALCIVPGLAVGRDWIAGAPDRTAVIALTTPVDPSTFTRRPLDLVVVVDHSGSMASDGRLDKVKAGLGTLVDNLRDTDRLAIVSFDDRVTVDAALPALGEPLARTSLHAIVDNLRPRGGTDIFDGLDAGFAQLPTTLAGPTDRERRVILLSDGNATAGDTDPAHILAMADAHVETGVGLTTIGVGADFDVALMRGLAEHGAGNFYFLEDPTAATEVFAQELDYFTTPLATELALTATTGAGYRVTGAVGSHLWTDGGGDGGAFAIPAAFVASRTSSASEPGRRGGGSAIFLALERTDTAPTTPTDRVAHLQLTYRDAATGELVAQALDLVGGGSEGTADAPYLVGDDVARRYAMYHMYQAFAAATTEAPACARATLTAARGHAETWLAHHDDPDLAADVALLDEYVANLDAADPNAAADAATCDLANPTPIPYDQVPMACSTTGGHTGALGGLVVLLAVLYTTACSTRRSTRRAATR